MADGAPKGLTIHRALAAILGVLLSLVAPWVVTMGIVVARTRFDLTFLFLYLPSILFTSYLSGLGAGILSAITSTALASYIVLEPVGLSVSKVRAYGLPAALFLLTGNLMAVAGDQYRRYRDQLRHDLVRARRHERHEALLVHVADALVSGAAPARVADQICAACTEVLGERCAIVLINSPSEEIRLQGFHTRADAQPAQRRDVFEAALTRYGDALIRALFHLGEPIVVTRDADPRVAPQSQAREWLDVLGARSALWAPLRLGEDHYGALVILAGDTGVWGEEERQLARAVADRLALASDRRRRLEQRARRERHARVLADIMVEFFQEQTLTALLDRAALRCTEALGEWCSIHLLSADQPEIQVGALHHQDPSKTGKLSAVLQKGPYRRGDSLTTGLLEDRMPRIIIATDPRGQELVAKFPALQEAFTQLGVRGILAVPVYVGTDALGILTLGRETRRHWDDEDVLFASAIADRAGAAIRNARLIESERQARAAAEREARRVAAVNRIIAIAAKSLDLGAVFDEFAEALQLLLPFVRVTVWLYDPERDSLTMPYFKGSELPAADRRLAGPKAGTVRGRVLDTAQAYLRKDTFDANEFAEDQVFAEAGIRSYAVVPMSVGGRVIGTLNFGHYEPGFYTEAHARLVQPIADHLAITLSHSGLFEQVQRRAGELSEALQHALLPADLPRAPFVALGALYRAADTEAGVGGDWYDAILLPDDTIMLSIGDMAGRGVTAAADMGQVRHVVRAYALEGRPPAEILTAVNDFLCRVGGCPFLSIWIGVLDPYRGALTCASAGHPAPRLVQSEQVSSLDGGGPPIGTSLSTQYGELTVPLAPGARLIAYTDGLIEASRDVIDGERRLTHAAQSTADLPPDRAVAALVDRVLEGQQPADDIALLIVDRLPLSAPLTLTVPAAPENLRHIRLAVRTYAERLELPSDRRDAMVIAVGEATLNVVEHAYGGRSGRLALHGDVTNGAIVITVRDHGRWRSPTERGRGRGTRIMNAFADSVKIQTTPGGTQVELTWRASRPAAALP